MENTTNINNRYQRLTQAKKDANDKEWYKEQLNVLSNKSFSSLGIYEGTDITDYKRMKVNYDLFNNIINLRDFEYVCKPYGSQVGELPAQLTNRDIISPKIKVLIGMEMKRPFSWKVMAVNEEATTRKEQEEFGKIKEYVINSILQPIKQKQAIQYEQEYQGRELTEEEQQQIMKQVEQDMQTMTPDEVRQYMRRDHQDPAEALAHQLLEYTILDQDIKFKFNKAWKHALITGKEIYWVGIMRDKPVIKVINPLYFDCDKSPDIDFIEDGEWAVCEYRMTPSEIVANFDLTEEEIDELYAMYPYGASQILDSDFTFNNDRANEAHTIRVLHAEWKSLTQIGFLTYKNPENPDGEPLQTIVNENYKLNKKAGDISIEWEWIPERHEGYKIGATIYKNMRPVPGQYRDMDNLYQCKLSYIGGMYDNTNSHVTSPVDRMKAYQYFLNILWYRIELLMASDKGKKVLMNINAIPKSANIDLNKWLYFADALNLMFFNPNEEGNKGNTEAGSIAKEIDMSLVSQINQYIELAAYVEDRCGASVGITKQMEGQIRPNDAVTNTKQSLLQSSHILEPYFEHHNNIKRNVLQQVIEVCKIAYTQNKPKKLTYILDDLSNQLLNVDQGLLENSTLGIFVSNSSKAFDAKQLIENLAQAAMQNQAIELSDVIKVVRSEGVQEAEELLEAAEDKREARNQQAQIQQTQAEAEMEEKQRQHEKEQWKHEADMIILKEEERRKTELQKQAMLSIGFDPNKDEDNDGEPDIMEVYKHGLDTNIKTRKQNLEENKFQYQKELDKKKIALEEKKIAAKSNAIKK